MNQQDLTADQIEAARQMQLLIDQASALLLQAAEVAQKNDLHDFNEYPSELSSFDELAFAISSIVIYDKDEMPRDEAVSKIATEFANVLRKWLGPVQFAKMQRRNMKSEENVCASHDFCDANMAMAEAFETVLNREPNVSNASDTAIWNAAWDKAKAEELTAKAVAA